MTQVRTVSVGGPVKGLGDRLLLDVRILFRYPSQANAAAARDLLAQTTAGLAPVDYWVRRALGHYLLTRFDDSLRALAVALRHEPRSAEAHHLRGVCLQLLALESAQRDPGFPAALSSEARQRFELARDAFRRALELNPDDDESRQNLAGLRVWLGDAEPDGVPDAAAPEPEASAVDG